MKKKKKDELLSITSPIYKTIENTINKINERHLQIALVAQQIDNRFDILTSTFNRCDIELFESILDHPHFNHLNDLLTTISKLKLYDKFIKHYICRLIDICIINNLHHKKTFFKYHYTLNNSFFIIKKLLNYTDECLNVNEIALLLSYLGEHENLNEENKQNFTEQNKQIIKKYLGNFIHITVPEPYSHFIFKDGVTHVMLNLNRPLEEIIEVIKTLKQEYEMNPENFKSDAGKFYKDAKINYSYIQEEAIKIIFYTQ